MIDLDYVLPCDVRLEPATVITKGCKLSTLLAALKVRESADWHALENRDEEWAARYRQAIRDLNNTTDTGVVLPNGMRGGGE